MSWNPGVLPLAGVFGSKAVFLWCKSRMEVARSEITRDCRRKMICTDCKLVTYSTYSYWGGRNAWLIFTKMSWKVCIKNRHMKDGRWPCGSYELGKSIDCRDILSISTQKGEIRRWYMKWKEIDQIQCEHQSLPWLFVEDLSRFFNISPRLNNFPTTSWAAIWYWTQRWAIGSLQLYGWNEHIGHPDVLSGNSPFMPLEWFLLDSMSLVRKMRIYAH